MTAREIAQAVGKDERSVQRWAKKAGDKVSAVRDKVSAAGHGKPADYTLDETVEIIATGLGRNAAELYRQNAEAQQAPAPRLEGSSLNERDLAIIGGIVASVMAKLQSDVDTIKARVDSRAALLPAPTMDPRSQLNKVVRDYAHQSGMEYRQAWRELYREYGYRTHSNPTLSAKNRGMTTVDYLEAEGQLDTLLAVALDLLERAA